MVTTVIDKEANLRWPNRRKLAGRGDMQADTSNLRRLP
jgi:hypothetical protein